jgi:chitodextrinase
VDNTPPTDITLSKRSTSSQSITLNFDAFDVMSKKYSDVNPDVGRKGIKQFTLALKDQNDNIVASSTSLGTEPSWHKAVGNSNVQPNTTYTAFVTVTDLAGNSTTSTGLNVTTAPRAPHNLEAASQNHCSVTLTWDASPGATSYKVCNTTVNLSDVRTTTSTAYTFTGLSANTTYAFYVMAVGPAGESDRSNINGTT